MSNMSVTNRQLMMSLWNYKQYALHVEESCCFCTETGLYKMIE